MDAALRRTASRWIDRLGLRRAVFRSREWLISRRDTRIAAPPGGPPVPPPYLRTLVVGTPDLDWFLQSGERDAAEFEARLRAAGAPAFADASVLEWGCGCGRLSRHVAPRSRAFTGVDINRRLVRWCAAHLPGDYRTVAPRPPTALAEASVDLAYGCSVLTHLREDSAEAWLAELARLLKPGGFALLTFHDPEHPGAAGLEGALAERGWAVRFDRLEGSNNLAAYATAQHLATLASPRLRLASYAPSSQSTSLQAVAVFARAPA